MLPEKGKTYVARGATRYVTHVDVDRKVVSYVKNDSPMVLTTSLHTFTNQYMGQMKPLDKAFKEMTPVKVCAHTNIRKDHFFSAMVYLTCKDCGKALN